VPGSVTQSINKILLNTNGRAKVYDDTLLDFTFVSNPVITDQNMAIYLNATLFN